MIDTKKIFRDFIQNDEALDAEVTSSGVMLSEEDCLTLMDRVVKKLTIPVVVVPKGTLCECKGSGGIRMDGTCARCTRPLELND